MIHTIWNKYCISIVNRFIAILLFLIWNGHIACMAAVDFNDRFSAQIADMARYGSVNTPVYTGNLNVGIPIYNLPDPDFPLSLSLQYNAEGFKPRKHSGYVGYSWFLQVGGFITREVQNYPDEVSKDVPNNNAYSYEGMLHYVRNHKHNKEDVFALDTSIIHSCGSSGYVMGDSCMHDVDYMPDLFRFNFWGYNGSFMIDNQGDVIIIEGDFVKVDLSALNDESDNVQTNQIPTPQANSSIRITTKDGYQYVFGGDLSSVEYTISALSGYRFVSDQVEFFNGSPKKMNTPVINTWHLTRIIAPNGREMVYHYKPTVYENPHKEDPLWEFNEYYDHFAKYYEAYLQTGNIYSYCNNVHYGYSMTKLAILDSITIHSSQPVSIRFYNSQEEHRMYYHPAYSLCQSNFQLDSVIIKACGRILQRARLTYSYQSKYVGEYSFNWRFLSSVQISGVGLYQLTYYHTDDLPNLSLYSDNYALLEADEYGFWKGSAKQSMLESIVFPTGGRQVYDYAQHYFEKKKTYHLYDVKDIQMITSDNVGTLSGSRISTITTYNGQQLVEKKEYIYSNGVFHDNLYVYDIPNTPNNKFPTRSRGNYSMLNSHIGYGSISEVTTLANGERYKTTYEFSTGLSDYNSAEDSNYNQVIPLAVWGNREIYIVLSGVLFYTGQLVADGKLLSVKSYNNENKCIQSKLFTYNGISTNPMELQPIGLTSLGCTDTIVIFSNYNLTSISKRLFVYPNVLSQQINYNYDRGHPLHNTTNYIYDRKLRVKRQTAFDSKGTTLFTEYTYPDDLILNYINLVAEPIQYLVRNYRINEPIEIISGFEELGQKYVTAGQINKYEDNICYIPVGPNYTQIFIKHIPYLCRTLSLQIQNPVTNYQYAYINEAPLRYDARYRITCEYTYNSMLRLTMEKPLGTTPTYYEWDGILPIRKTLGNQTTTYTHIPYVGISSSTDSRGIETHYVYDDNGKLIETYLLHNGRKEILNSYQYHVLSE